jgi:hypothetical protein
MFFVQRLGTKCGMVVSIHWTSHPYVIQENVEEIEIVGEEYL